MSFLNEFDPDAYEPESFAPIPAGWYTVAITEAEEKDSQRGGTYIKLVIDLLEGQYKGRKVFTNLNVVNANPKAEDIARRQLSAILAAVGVQYPKSYSEILNIPLRAKLAVRPETEEYEASNDVKGWEPVVTQSARQVMQAGVSSAPTAQPAQPAAGTAGKKPWEK